MKRFIILLTTLLLCFAALAGGEKSKKKLRFSFSERTRLTVFDNAINLDETMNDTFAFTRHRTSVGLFWSPSDNIDFNVKLTNEFRTYLSPKNRDSDMNEIFFDQLYVKWKNIGETGITLTLGRQNIMLGEGFICLDGQPHTGSRSAYFNAVRLDYKFNEKHRVTGFVSYIPRYDNWLPVINEPDPKQSLEEQANTGVGIYYQGNLGKTGVHAYYFRKDTHNNDNYPIESGINTFGIRLTIPLVKRLALTTEGALQSGSYGSNDRSGTGGYFHLDYKIGEIIPIVNTLTFGGIYLSGDDPSTDKVEGWDPLWSRWPKWSESYIYTLIRENGVAYWSNIKSLYLSAAFTLNKQLSGKASYYLLWSDEYGNSSKPSFASMAGEGKKRGNLIVTRFNYKISKHMSGHFVWENFKPGSFYRENADGYNWFRFELMVRY